MPINTELLSPRNLAVICLIVLTWRILLIPVVRAFNKGK